MIVCLIILGAMAAVGIPLYIHYRITSAREDSQAVAEVPAEGEGAAQEGAGCCGMHITCEKDSLLAAVSGEVEYYDDEELDAYRGRRSDDYAEAEIEQFRDVLLTLLPEDIAGWGRSLQLRSIELPDSVREELLMIVAEERKKK